MGLDLSTDEQGMQAFLCAGVFDCIETGSTSLCKKSTYVGLRVRVGESDDSGGVSAKLGLNGRTN